MIDNTNNTITPSEAELKAAWAVCDITDFADPEDYEVGALAEVIAQHTRHANTVGRLLTAQEWALLHKGESTAYEMCRSRAEAAEARVKELEADNARLRACSVRGR